MQNRTFSKRSLLNLRGVHPALIYLNATALHKTPHDFVVIDGLRTRQEQAILFNKGKSKTLNSAHLTGYATDSVPIFNGDIQWRDPAPFVDNARVFLECAADMNISVRWGGDWDRDGDHKDERFFDSPHMELDRPAFDWSEAHPLTERDEWPADMQELLRFDTSLCPIRFDDQTPEVFRAPHRVKG